ncbi:SseB family protein [Cumulibacter soli]|uniref:SseB family protein n=1 Tax=Cumulibacter soli TaxID=2546344 RepID=UPI0014196CDA|nr:SseB family protein [Cumulibacter soli]
MTGPIRAHLPWQASSEFEQQLTEAFAAADTARCYGLLMPAQFVMPTTQEAFEQKDPARWPTYTDDERTFVVVYTSFEAMAMAASGNLTHGVIVRLDDLAAAWPDPAFGLAINPGLGVAFYFESGMLARLAAPPIELLDTPEGRFDLVLQKVIAPTDVEAMIEARVRTVSGYCQFYWHVEHLSNPGVLIDDLGLPRERYLDEYGATFVLRWRPLALSLYADAYGGQTAAARDLVGGSIVEEPPFVGLGFGPAPTQVIREFKANCAPLPTGAELWEISETGQRRIAMLDLAAGGWRLIARTDEVQASAHGQDER